MGDTVGLLEWFSQNGLTDFSWILTNMEASCATLFLCPLKPVLGLWMTVSHCLGLQGHSHPWLQLAHLSSHLNKLFLGASGSCQQVLASSRLMGSAIYFMLQ